MTTAESDTSDAPIEPQTGSPNPHVRHPSISKQTEDETSAIAASLASRRQRGSLRNVFTGKSIKARTKSSEPPDGRGSDAEEEEDESALRALMEEGERMKAEMPKAVEVLRHGRTVVDVDEEVFEGARQEFVWDVLFQNERGFHLFGKAHFSSLSLLPSDPSAYTVPSHTLPSASSFKIAADGSLKVQRRRTKPAKNTRDPRDRNIKTLYTPQTYQTPSPAWMWVATWMVNMRTGTDEGGWRYNAWFRKGGWKSHAGPAGWGGWVRRREWVRLRCLTPQGTVLDVPMARENEVVDTSKGLGEVMGSAHTDENVDSVLKAMGRIPLDRQKVDTWRKWLDDGDRRSYQRLQRILDDDRAAHNLSRSMTHHTTIENLLQLFKQHELSVSNPNSPSSSPRPIASTGQRDTPSTSPKPDIDD